MTRNVAAIDIGSNSTNLLVTDEHGAQLVREVNVTALGEGVARTNVLSPAAIERTLAVIGRYAAVVAQHNAELHITGTAACRMASNTRDFFAQVRTATGVGPRLLSAADEARLAWHGAVASLPATDGDTMVIDIGGASTELTVGTLPGVPAQSSVQSSALTSVSLPFGVVTLTEAELHSDPPRAEELSNAVSMVGDAVDNAAIEYPQLAGAQRVVGVAGSIVTIAAVELGLQQFDAARLHGMVLTKSAAEDVFRTLATERLADRVHNPGLPVERAGVIVGGCCLLVAIMRRLHLDHIIVSTHNLLDGVVAEARAARNAEARAAHGDEAQASRGHTT
jgi:exopolyphosphatase/guanosine-5'-triphosphate,3'-diphosphate pyrophosphatase